VQAVGGAALNSDEIPVAGRAAERVDAPAADDPRAVDPAEGRSEQPAVAPGGRRRSLVLLAVAGAFALLVDILTKQLAVSGLRPGEPVRLLGGAVYLDLIRNSGAAFSLGTRYTFVFPLITVVVVAWIFWAARRLRSAAWAVALGLVLGGALGNLTDRIFRAPGPMVGHVVDMVSLFGPNGQFWPVFNAADAALCVGVSLAVLLELTGRRLDGTHARTGDQAGVPDSAGG
jgi:signal peptidase II